MAHETISVCGINLKIMQIIRNVFRGYGVKIK